MSTAIEDFLRDNSSHDKEPARSHDSASNHPTRMVPLPDEITSQLDALGRRIRLLAVTRGALRAVVALVAGLGVGMLIDWQLNLPVSIRLGLLLTAVTPAAVVFWRTGLSAAVRKPSYPELAAVVERLHPDLQERLSTALEFTAEQNDFTSASSDFMLARLRSEAVNCARKIDFLSAVPTQPIHRAGCWSLAAVLLWLAPAVFWPNQYSLLLQRFAMPWANLERAAAFEIVVPDGDRTTPRGDDVAIRAELVWHHRADASDFPPGEVRLNWTSESGAHGSRAMIFDHQPTSEHATDTADPFAAGQPGESVSSPLYFDATVSRVTDNIAYYVSLGNYDSRVYRLQVADRPKVTQTSVHVQPPAYTGLPAARFGGSIEQLTVFERSIVQLTVNFSHAVSEAEFDWQALPGKEESGNATTVTLAPDGLSTVIEFTAVEAARFQLALVDHQGIRNDEAFSGRVTIETDQPPRLTFNQETPDRVRPNETVPLAATAEDDFGVTALELHYVLGQGEEASPGDFAAEASRLDGVSVSQSFELNLASLGARAGQIVTYRFRAADNRPIPGPQEVWSPPQIIAIHEDAPPLEGLQLARRQDAIREQIQELKRQTTELQEQLQDEAKPKTGEQPQQTKADNTAAEKAKPTDTPAPPADGRPLTPDERRALAAGQASEAAQLAEGVSQRLAEQRLYERLAADVQALVRDPLAEVQTDLSRGTEPTTGQTAPPKQADKARQNPPPGQKSQPIANDETRQRLEQVQQNLANVERQFDQLTEIERDLQQLGQLAQRAERLADEATQLSQQAAKMPDAAQSDAATKPADPNAANAQQAADLAARQQQLQQQHAAIDNNLENLLERRPELVDAARQHQLDRLSRLAQQAADLAERQRQLGEQLAEAPQTDPAANPSTAPQAGDRPAGEQPAAERSPGEPAAANPQPANASRPEPSRPQPPTPEPQAANPSTDGPAKGTQPAGQSPAGNDPSAGSQPGESAAGETPAGNKPASEVAPNGPQQAAANQIAQADQDQRAVTSEAVRQALQSAEVGPEDNAAREAAAEFARSAARAAGELASGQLSEAAQSSQQAAVAAQQAADAMNRASGRPTNAEGSPAATAQQLAAEQARIANALSELAGSPQAQRAARERGQQNLTAAGGQLAESLADASSTLGENPLSLEQAASQSQAATQSARSAVTSMQQAARSINGAQTEQAAQSAASAREALQQASRQAAEAAGVEPPGPSPVPGDLANDVTDAARALKQAGEELARSQQPQSRPADGEKGEGTAESSQQQANAEGKSDGQSGEGQPGQQKSAEGAQASASEKAAADDGQPDSSEKASGDAAGQQGQSSQPNGQGQNSTSQSLALAAQALRRVAESLSDATADMQMQSNNSSQPGQQTAEMTPGQGNGKPGENSTDGFGSSHIDPFTMGDLKIQLDQLSARNWGQLPGKLSTEIHQGASRRTDGEYGELIQLYFREVARQTQSANNQP